MTERITQIYRSVLDSINPIENSPDLKVEFYPYVGISNRIRRRDCAIFVRISDVLRGAPTEFHRALAQILIRKLYRKRVSAKDLQIYRDYLRQADIQAKSIENRRARGRKVITTTKGNIYDLDELYALLNQIYFQNTLPKPVLTWSAKKTFRILGHHDSAHKTIVISKSLDDKNVPRFVAEYVLYHEMLHIKHPTVHHNGRRYNHTPVFRRDEENFAFFREAETWIERNISVLKKKAKRK